MSLLEDEAQPLASGKDLQFQDFRAGGGAPTGGGGGKLGSAIGSGVGSGAVLQPASAGGTGFEEPAQRPEAVGGGGFWSIKYYQPLFDVDTVQVLNRVKGALLPRPKGAFFELVNQNPDLYGPFWISTTLIFAMAMTGNLASFFAFTPTARQSKWTYDFNQLTVAGSVVYSYVTLLPMLVWLLLRYFEAPKKLADVLCIYGYTLAIFVPISVACVIPSNSLRWALVLLGGGISGVFILSNFHAHLADCFPYGEGDAKRKTLAVLGGMALFHAVLVCLLKMCALARPPGPRPGLCAQRLLRLQGRAACAPPRLSAVG